MSYIVVCFVICSLQFLVCHIKSHIKFGDPYTDKELKHCATTFAMTTTAYKLSLLTRNKYVQWVKGQCFNSLRITYLNIL